MREAVHVIAGLGDFFGRKCDGQPGPQVAVVGPAPPRESVGDEEDYNGQVFTIEP